jgi:DNA-directed RNA polymerase subunit RPC12/RpoP
MIICVNCRKEMRCDKNGVGADFGNGHVYASDRYKCDECGAMILKTNREPVHDPEHKWQDEYLKMDTGERS